MCDHEWRRIGTWLYRCCKCGKEKEEKLNRQSLKIKGSE